MEQELRALLNEALSPTSEPAQAEAAFKSARILALQAEEGWWIALHPRLSKHWSSAANQTSNNHPTPRDFSLTYTPRAAYKPDAMPFGKYKGQLLADLAMERPDYLRWLLENCENLRPPLREAIEDVLD